MVIVGSWGCMFYWCMFYVWENDVNNRTMTASELADRIKRGEKWKIDDPHPPRRDRVKEMELLVLAAKAACIEWATETDWGLIDKSTRPDCPKLWNPLTDDGDAFRLMVKLTLE